MKEAQESTLLDQLAKLGPEARLGLARGLVKRFVEGSPDGVTANAVAGEIGLSYQVVKRHLDYLVATRQLYVHEAGPRTLIYFPNARLSHPYSRAIFRLGDQTFRTNLIENLRGKFVYIQEMRTVPSTGEQIAGGIIIRLEHVTEFLQQLRSFVESEGAGRT